jgi:hypothetical protein
LNRYKYDLVFPWAVTIAVKLGVKLIFIFSLSLVCVLVFLLQWTTEYRICLQWDKNRMFKCYFD